MKLGVLIPSLNQAQYLDSAMRSVIDQSRELPKTKVRLLDGGSGPEVQNIIKRLKSDYPGLAVHSAPDDGQADALARGFAGTDADILGWLNSDDLLLPGSLQKVVEAFGPSPEIDVLYGEGLYIDESGTCAGAYPTAPHDPELLRSFCYLSQPSTFFRKSAYMCAGGIDAGLKYALDYDLWLRLLASGARFQYLPELLSATRLHSQSKTATGRLAFAREVLACQRKHFPHSGNAGRQVWKSYRRLIARVPVLPRPAALALAWIIRLPYLLQIPESTAWVYRVIKFHLQAKKRARTYLGKSFP